MTLVLIAAACLVATSAARAAEHEIQMRNKGETGLMVFEPAFLEMAPGDVVHFRAVNKGHNAASIDGMIPEGAAPWKGGLNKDVTVTLDVEGVYGVRCVPHYPMGMVALIVVGDPGAQSRGRPPGQTARQGQAADGRAVGSTPLTAERRGHRLFLFV